MFDPVILNEPLSLTEGKIVPTGTPGTIVEVLGDGKAYMVELFGSWLIRDQNGDLEATDHDMPNAFRETIGLETVLSHQIRAIKPMLKSSEVNTRLLTLMDDLSEHHLEEIADFAEFLYHKQHHKVKSENIFESL